jgi:hypothetical protein
LLEARNHQHLCDRERRLIDGHTQLPIITCSYREW